MGLSMSLSGQPVPENDLPATPDQQVPDQQAVSGQSVPESDLPDASGEAVPSEDLPEDAGSTSDYTTPEEQLKTAAEGAAQGVIGPAALWIETNVLGVNPQDIVNREQANPFIHGGAEAAAFAGSMLTGTGEAALFSHVGEAIAKTAKVGKIGSAAIRTAIEGGLLQGSDEISKAILGQGDPESPVSSALINSGVAAVMGGFGGAFIEGAVAPALQSFGESKVGTAMSQFASDMGSRLKFWQENPDMVHAFTGQLNDLHAANEASMDEIYGASQRKAQNIAKLTMDVTPQQLSQATDTVSSLFDSAPDILQKSAAFQDIKNEWLSKTTSQIDPISLQPTGNQPSAANVFMATDAAKRRINNEIAKFGSRQGDTFLANTAKQFYGKLGDTLEDTDTWNDAGTFQNNLNAAVSKFIPNQENMLKTFYANDAEFGKIVSPQKANTYINQLGKPSAEIKQDFIKRYVNASETFQTEINALHNSLGIDSPVVNPPTDILKGTYGEQSPGTKMGDFVFHKLIPHISVGAGGVVAGANVGYQKGGVEGAVVGGLSGAFLGALAPHIESAAGTALRKYAVPGIIRALSSGAPEAAGKVLNYTNAAASGAAKLSRGIHALFESGGTQAIDAAVSAGQKEKLKKFVENNELQKQIQKQAREPAQGGAIVQGFAQGGEVKKIFQPIPKEKPSQPVLQSVGGISKAMPEQAEYLAAAKSRVNDYLNSIRPNPISMGLPFDKEMPQTVRAKSYDKALDLAIQPLGILNHMKAGTLTPELLGHFKSMWPEVHNHISKKLTERILKSQMSEERPSYRVRQSMSLFLGSPLDSTLTPQAIQSVQAIYAPKQPIPPPGVPPKKQTKNTSKLGEIPKDHYTQDQASQQRATAWD
jgi:hypothetical protein